MMGSHPLTSSNPNHSQRAHLQILSHRGGHCIRFVTEALVGFDPRTVWFQPLLLTTMSGEFLKKKILGHPVTLSESKGLSLLTDPFYLHISK